MARLTSFLVLCGLLVLAPALCLGGVLEHACACSQGGDLQCPHEASCSGDPCVTVARLQKQDLEKVPSFEAPAVPVALLPARAPAVAKARSAPAAVPPWRPNLPYAPGERPLRL